MSEPVPRFSLWHRAAAHLMHRPGLQRLLGRLLRAWPPTLPAPPVVVRWSQALELLNRPADFDNRSYVNDPVTQGFILVAETGERHRCKRAEFIAQLAPAPACGSQARAAAQLEIKRLAASNDPFDLIDDYLAPVCWIGLLPLLGAPVQLALESAGQPTSSRAELFEDLRRVGAHMMLGRLETQARRDRADQASADLDRRLRIASRFSTTGEPDEVWIERVRGLLWVSHPSLQQAGALVVQEWLTHREVYKDLVRQARQLQGLAWTDPGWRNQVRAHVREAMRQRPPFPMLGRAAPRDTQLGQGHDLASSLRAGQTIGLIGPAAMDDPAHDAHAQPYRATRTGPDLVFGQGPRQCPAADHSTEILVGALIGLLQLGPLDWGDELEPRIRYDGQVVRHLLLSRA